MRHSERAIHPIRGQMLTHRPLWPMTDLNRPPNWQYVHGETVVHVSRPESASGAWPTCHKDPWVRIRPSRGRGTALHAAGSGPVVGGGSAPPAAEQRALRPALVRGSRGDGSAAWTAALPGEPLVVVGRTVQVQMGHGRAPGSGRHRQLDRAIADPHRVETEPSDPRQSTGLGLLAGRVDLGVTTGG